MAIRVRRHFHKATWTDSYRRLNIGPARDLASLRPLLLRLRPTVLTAQACNDANLDALQGLSGLRRLRLSRCTALPNVDGLKGLSGLQSLVLHGCPALKHTDALARLTGLLSLNLGGCRSLQNVDGLKGLSGLQELGLNGCTALQSVDALTALSGLQVIGLYDCPKLPGAAVAALRVALPKAEIRSDYDP